MTRASDPWHRHYLALLFERRQRGLAGAIVVSRFDMLLRSRAPASACGLSCNDNARRPAARLES